LIAITIPGRGSYNFKYLVLDLNGTIAVDGEIIGGVGERLQQLSSLLSISIVTADTHGSARQLEKSLDIKIHRVEAGKEAAQKLALVQQLGKENAICIGNGSNDASMLRESALGICVAGGEGASGEAVLNSDLIVSNINDAFDLLLKPNRLVATLRK
jgi:P-type E1-E2 ATPase